MKLSIIGLGISGTDHLTQEALEILKSVDKVLCLPNAANDLDKKLEVLGISNHVDLMDLYHSGEVDNLNYERIYDKVLNDCEHFGHVGFLVPGHPRVGVSLVSWFEQRVPDTGIDLEVLPGLSSLDTMINNLQVDPIERGSVMLDVNRLLLFEYTIEPCLDHYFYHVCSIGTSEVHIDDPKEKNRLDLFQAYLENFYPAEHRVQLICSPSDAESEVEIIDGQVGDLANLLPHIHFGTTLFVPGKQPAKVNAEYLALLQDTAVH